MNERQCEICHEWNNSENHVLELTDDKRRVQFNGHKQCVDDLHLQIKNVKDLRKKSVEKVFDEIGIVR